MTMTGVQERVEERVEERELRLRGFAVGPSESLCHFVTSPFEKGGLTISGWRRIESACGASNS
jgi:hypothetical protein